MKDLKDCNIFDLMAIPIEELKELSIEEFSEEINGKKVNINAFTDNNRLETNGNIRISATNSHIYVKENTDGYNISMWGDSNGYSHLYIDISERIIFGIYSYENDKDYRIAFEGNSPDLLINVVGGRLNKSSK